VFVIDWFCLTTFLVGYRVVLKNLYLRYKAGPAPNNIRRVLIWGAGDAGELCLRYLQNDKQTKYEVVGFLDDASLKRNRRLNGVKILGSRHHLELLAKLYKIQEVFLAMANLPEREIQIASEICSNLGLEAKLFQLSAVSCNGSAVEHNSGSVDHAPACEISPRLSTATNHSK
jgi:UDP-GlcNAc:undecaprenyl-phosphate GlcNAc-1-phosphate transferase